MKVLSRRLLAMIGIQEDVGWIPIAIGIGFVTAIAAVAFHELIEIIKHLLYEKRGGDWLYGPGIWALALIPALGGLVVGLIGRYLVKAQSGHGVVDVIESVIRTRGFVRPIVAIEKIITAAISTGSGGSCGAEGPIVQIGAAISSGIGRVLSISPQRMPLLIGCGTAAGISSIFHSPIGGVIFTLEVIIRDFSARALVPIVVASVVANVSTQWAFGLIEPEGYRAIFASPDLALGMSFSVSPHQAAQFALLGVICGLIGVCFTRMLLLGEKTFARLRWLGAFRPMLGGLMVGGLGVLFVLLFGWLLNTPKPIPFGSYPMPAFFGDGYGVIKTLLQGQFGVDVSFGILIALLMSLIVLKMVGTTLTLASGGSGGIIAPSLFLGATTGTLLGEGLRAMGFDSALPRAMALVGMGASLAAVVHAPLASILIVFELTQSPGVMVPAMLATVTAYGIARTILPDSVYTLELRHRGLEPDATAHTSVLRKYAISNLPLESMSPVHTGAPIQRVIELAIATGQSNFIVTDSAGCYLGIIPQTLLQTVLIQSEAIPLLTVDEVMRTDIQPLRHTENLAALFEAFVQYEIDALPVGLDHDPTRPIGVVTRETLMKHYQHHWREG